MLALKLLLVPSLIAAITLAGRRWGPTIAGWLSGFPVVAGPILLLIAIEQGPLFAADASGGALSGLLGNTAFCLGYSWIAVRLPWWVSLAAGIAAYAIAALMINALALPLYPTLILTLIGIWLALRLFPVHLEAERAARPSPTELPARMFAGAVLVLAVTFFASKLGPRLSGMFSAFPLMACVLASFSHSASGPSFAVRLLRGLVVGFFGLAAFCFILVRALPAWGTTAGFALALSCATLVQVGALWIRSSALADPGSGRCDEQRANSISPN